LLCWTKNEQEHNSLAFSRASVAIYTATTQGSQTSHWNFTKTAALLPSGDGQKVPPLGHQAQWNLFLDPVSGKYIPTFSTPGTTSQNGDPPIIGRFVLRDTTAFNPKWKTKTVGYNIVTNLTATTGPQDSTCGIHLAKSEGGILTLSPEIDNRRRYEPGYPSWDLNGGGVSIRLDTTVGANNFAVVLRKKHHSYNTSNTQTGAWLGFSVGIGERDGVSYYQYYQTGLKNGYVFFLKYDTTSAGVKRINNAGTWTSLTNTLGIDSVSRSTMQGWHYMECKYSYGGLLTIVVNDDTIAYKTSETLYRDNPKSILLSQQPQAGAKNDGATTAIDFFAVRKYYNPEPQLTIRTTQYSR
jgi:hypothetical protein